MIHRIERDRTLEDAPTFRFEPDWPPGGPDLESLTDYMIYMGLRLPADRVPRRAVMLTKHKSLKDVIGLDMDAWCVSEAFRRVVEHVAPKQVEYIPIEIVRKNGRSVSHQHYYFINVLSRIDTIDWPSTEDVVVSADRNPAGRPYVEAITESPVFSFAKSRHPKGVHIWHEVALDSAFAGLVFATDQLVEALMAGNLTGLAIQVMREV